MAFAMNPKPLAIVVQRFGSSVVGGAEAHARAIALKLLHELGYPVDVITTTAKDHTSWANHFPAGISDDEGLRVRRFDSRSGRSVWFRYYKKLTTWLILTLQKIEAAKPLAELLANRWFILQGPYSPDLIHFIKENKGKYQKFIFFTYLYYPTVFGLMEVKEKSILIPTAHDEPPFYFARVARLLGAAQSLLVNSEEEKALILRQHAVDPARIEIVGIGVDAQPETSANQDEPYALYLGRISKGKHVDELISWYQYWQSQPGARPYRLVLAGQLEDISLPSSPGISYKGFVSDKEKADLISGASLLINPSGFESLSMIVLEALKAEIPALVNGRSPVLQYYADQCQSVFSYQDRESFLSGIQKITELDWTSQAQKQILRASSTWVEDHYGWKKVLQKYQSAICEP